MLKAEPVARDVVWVLQGHMRGYFTQVSTHLFLNHVQKSEYTYKGCRHSIANQSGRVYTGS